MVKNEYVVNAIERIESANQQMIQAAQWHNTTERERRILHNTAFFNYTHTTNDIRNRFKSLLKRNKVIQQDIEFIERFIHTNTSMLIHKYEWKINGFIQYSDGRNVKVAY